SASFTLEYELNQQETMGTVATGKNAFETFQFDFAKPNLIKASCTRERDAKYRWEIGCDGKYLLRVFNGTAYIEQAAGNLPDLLRQEGTAWGWDYFVNPREVLSMFDPKALTQFLGGRSIRYGGTRKFGSLNVDYVILSFPPGSVYKRLHFFIATGQYPVPLMMVRDGDRFYPAPYKMDDPANKERSLDTEWRFKNWRFNSGVTRDSFRLTMPNQPLVSAMSDMAYAPKRGLPKFVGSQLPQFTVIDQDGTSISSDVLLGDKPAVLFLWHDEDRFHQYWNEVTAAENRYGADKIQTFAIYLDVGNQGKAEVQSILQAAVDTDKLENAETEVRPRLFAALNYSDKRLLQAERYAYSEICAVIDDSRKVVFQQPGYGRFDFRKSVLKAADSMLRGRDFIAEQISAAEAANASLEREKKEWNQRFQTSWDENP
ncbi:MAG: hypothetical protein AAF802_21550, partial [Planctomycetota bacterium]